jgi:AhpD family alkylhydroperoxidase
VPHFFVYAKDKEDSQVEEANESFVNKLDYKIVNPKINSRNIGLKSIDYKLMVSNPDIECKVVFNKNGKINEELSDPMIVKYFELNNKYHFKVNMECADMIKGELLNNTQLKQDLFFKRIATEIKYELSQFGYTDSEITDILVKLLYHIKPSSHKSVLWFCYGKYIVENLEKHIKQITKVIQCVDCSEWFEVSVFDSATERCVDCANEHKRNLARLRKQKQRKKEQCHATLLDI